MKFPSLESLFEKSGHTFKRFPIALIACLTGAWISIYLIHKESVPGGELHYLYNLIMSLYLGMLIFIAIPIYTERKGFNSKQSLLLYSAGILIVLAYYFSLPDYFAVMSSMRFALFSLALHLLISFLPFLVKNEINGFWQYNKTIFLRIGTSALYTGVLYSGLALAIGAIDQLFKVNISPKTYAYLWIMLASVFNTWFFLSDFPKAVETLESKTDYPRGLKIFTQYVLIPLLSVYLLILYSYMIKIVVNHNWPDGWVSYLVLCFSIAGILSLLLIHPVRNDESNKWIPVFSRFFYFAIFPLIILLFFAIKRRIADYGITEPRYYVLLLALWLLFIASYFLISKIKNIKTIPISLCLVALLSTFGPWGAFSVSERSQQKHLSELLIRNNRLKDGKVIQSDAKISPEDNHEISSVVDYLIETHGLSSMQDYFAVSLDSVCKTDKEFPRMEHIEQSKKILELVGLIYSPYYAQLDDSYFNFVGEDDCYLDIEGYDFFISNFSIYQNSESKDYVHNKQHYSLSFDKDSVRLKISSDSSFLNFDLKEISQKLIENEKSRSGSIPADKLTFDASCPSFSARMLVRNLAVQKQKKDIVVTNLSIVFFIKKNKEAVVQTVH